MPKFKVTPYTIKDYRKVERSARYDYLHAIGDQQRINDLEHGDKNVLPNKLNRRMKLARYPGLFARLRYNSNMIPAAYIGAPTPAQLKRPFKHPEPRFRGDGLNITKLRGPARRRNPKANPEKEMQMKWINDNYGDEPATGAKHKVKLKYKRKAAWEKAEKKADEPEPEGEQAQQGPKHRSPGYAKKKAARRQRKLVEAMAAVDREEAAK